MCKATTYAYLSHRPHLVTRNAALFLAKRTRFVIELRKKRYLHTMHEDALFELAYKARLERSLECGIDELDADADEESVFLNAPVKVRTGRVVYTACKDGDIHMCFGEKCKHVRIDSDNQYVCTISGLVVGVQQKRDCDPGWTGRSTGTSNVDEASGIPVGGWVKRRDMYAASVAAYRNAHEISDAEIVPLPVEVEPVPTIKKGALCVDEFPDATTIPKKSRSSRKENWTRESIDKLASEAVYVIDKLFIANLNTAPQESTLDPRLQNLEFVKVMAIRKYIKRCVDGESELNLDVLGNVVIHANEFVRGQRKVASARLKASALRATNKRKRTNAVFSGQIRNQLSRLIVSLWRASCCTKHFMNSKKGSDSFRPFAAGILYSLKRGLYLNDGTCVVPVLEELSVHLPALRSSSSTVAAKQLQSSSHRGICSIQKALASISQMSPEEAIPARTLLQDASQQGAFLREMVSRNS